MGRIVGPFGVAGWLKVKFFTEEADGLAAFDRWMVRGAAGWQEMALEDFEVHSKGPVAKLAGCDDRDAAERLRGGDVAIPRAGAGRGGQRNVVPGRPASAWTWWTKRGRASARSRASSRRAGPASWSLAA